MHLGVDRHVTAKSEEQLIQGAKNGCLDCFSQLYRQFYASMVAVGYSVLADRHLAEDAAQETFAIACQELQSLKHPDKFASWLAGICRNVSKQMLRSRKEVIAADRLATVDQKANDQHAALAVRQALWQLSARAREPIVLRYYNSMSYEQIAAVLGISQKAVHGRLIRAKRKLAKYLKRNGFPGGHYETF